MNGLVRCILCSGVCSTGGLGIVRICENRPFLPPKSEGADFGDERPEILLFAGLTLRGLRSCAAQQGQQFSSLVKIHASAFQ